MPNIRPERAGRGRMPRIRFASKSANRKNISGFRYAKANLDVIFFFEPDDEDIKSRKIAKPSPCLSSSPAGRRHGEAKVSCRLVAEGIHRVYDRRKVVEQWTQPREDLLARFGGRHAARRAVEQADAEALFEPANGLAQRSGRHA